MGGVVDQWEEIIMSIDQSEASITWSPASPPWSPPPWCPAPGHAPSPGLPASWWPMRRQYVQSDDQWEASITWWAAPWSPPAPAWSVSPETSAERRRLASAPEWPGDSWGMRCLTSLSAQYYRCCVLSLISIHLCYNGAALLRFSPQVTRAGQVWARPQVMLLWL